MNNPLISIIVPCYNQAQFLPEALQSVLEQTYTNWESIIVNDGSPDNTHEVAQEWLAKDIRFKYIQKENGGLSSARNAGITVASGEFILPLDADDRIGTRYLELAQNYFDQGFSIIYCQANFFGDVNKKWILREYSYKEILFSNQIFCCAFFRKSDWKLFKGYDENLKKGREDWDFWLSILDEESKVLRLNYLGFFYRRKEISMDSEINNNIKLLNETENYIYKKHLKKYMFYNINAILNAQYYYNCELQYNKWKLFFDKYKIAIKILKKLKILS